MPKINIEDYYLEQLKPKVRRLFEEYNGRDFNELNTTQQSLLRELRDHIEQNKAAKKAAQEAYNPAPRIVLPSGSKEQPKAVAAASKPEEKLIKPGSATAPHGASSVAELQFQEGLLNGIAKEANQGYVPNPHKSLVSLYQKKKRDADFIKKLLHPSLPRNKREAEFYKKEADKMYKKPSSFERDAAKLNKALKTKSVLKNAGKLTGGFKHKLDEINEKYGDYASDNLAKLLKPFQHEDMRRHGQTGNIASNFLSNVAKHREKEKAGLLERVGEKALDRAQMQSHAKAQHKQSLITGRQNDERQKALKLANAYDYSRGYKRDLDEDVNRTQKHEEIAARELQEQKNHKAKEWQDVYEHPKEQIKFATEAFNKLPFSKHKDDLPKRPDYIPNDALSASAGILGIAGGLSKTHKEKKVGGRIKRADGGALLQEATENAQKNNMDPLQSLKNVSRYDQIKAIEQKMKDRQQHKKGEKVVAQAPSNPIEEGSFMAKQYALRDKVLAHAKRLEQPRELNPMTAALEGLAHGLSDHPGFGMGAKAFIKGREGAKAHEASEDARAEKAVLIQKAIAKEMRDEEKDNRHMDLAERKAKAQEAHYKATEAQHERHHQEGLSKQDLAEKRFNALHGKAGIERPFNEKEHKRLKEAKALKQKASHLIKQAQELRELTNPETGIKTGNLFGNALESVGSHAGQNFVAGDRAKAERVRTITGDLIFSKHGELKNIPRSNEILSRLDQVKPSLNMSPEAFRKAVDDVEILGHHLNDLASETAGDLEGSSHASSDHSAPHYPDEQKEADEKELQALYAKRDAVRTHNRKKLGDIVQRHKRAEGGLVPGSDVYKMMMDIPLTRDLIMGLQGA